MTRLSVSFSFFFYFVDLLCVVFFRFGNVIVEKWADCLIKNANMISGLCSYSMYRSAHSFSFGVLSQSFALLICSVGLSVWSQRKKVLKTNKPTLVLFYFLFQFCVNSQSFPPLSRRFFVGPVRAGVAMTNRLEKRWRIIIERKDEQTEKSSGDWNFAVQ